MPLLTTFAGGSGLGCSSSLLERQARRPEEDLVLQLRETLAVMRQLVDYLTQERKETGEAVVNILTVNHPAFSDSESAELAVPRTVQQRGRAQRDSQGPKLPAGSRD